MSNRLPDWRSRLAAYVVEAMPRPFQQGRHDCGLFVAGAVEAMTGVDHAAHLRGRYKTMRGLAGLLKRGGHAGHVAFVASLFEEVPPAMAQVGDVAVVPGDIDEALGVVQGESIYVLRPDGMGLVPLTDALRAFRV